MAKTSVLILGGGIIGCALAEELARRGRRVTVVERGAIGAEASAAAAGILSAQMDVPTPGSFFDLCQAARKAYPSWVARLERACGLRVGFERRGVVYLSATETQTLRMDGRARWQRRAGLPVERWSAAQLRRQEPAVDGRFHGAFHFPLEGQVDNVLLMRALAAACRRAGVRLHERTPVRQLVVRHRRVTGVETDHGRLTASVVVNALGSWAPNLHGAPVTLPVEPARGQIVSFAGPTRLFHRPVMTDRAYIIQRQDGQLLLGSTVERVGFDKSLTVDGMHAILCGARRISSQLESCRFIEGWAGLRPYSATGYPILGPTSIEGYCVATGHFRHGILLAPVTATLMADLILHGRTSVELSLFLPR